MTTDQVDTAALRDFAYTLDRVADNDRNAVRVPLLHGAAAIQRSAADEIDRLRKTIEDAPHASFCITDLCTCWKAGVL